eukprot:COSAG04_NODE_9386_length_868_cov_1.301691_1_plen_117_part_10
MKLNLRVAGQPPLGLECGEGTSVAELKALACAAAQDPGPAAERKLVHRSSLLRSGTVGENGVEDGGADANTPWPPPSPPPPNLPPPHRHFPHPDSASPQPGWCCCPPRRGQPPRHGR